jgi:hypothetical protein
MKFVKYIDEHNVTFCPTSGKSINMFHTNLPRFYETHTDRAAEDGYYPLITSEKPEGNYLPTYTLSDIGVVQGWEQITTPVSVQIDELKQQLAETDYKVIKCAEYQAAGLQAPHDIAALHVERQAIRDEINALESN